MTNKQFYGWKFGGDLTPEQADLLEPFVDIFTNALQTLIYINTSPEYRIIAATQHELALTATAVLGRAAGLINSITLALAEEQNKDEQLLLLNEKATKLRGAWLELIALTSIAVNNLDKTLNGENDDGSNSTEDVRTDPATGS